MFRLNRNERSRWSGNGVHVEPESVFMIGRNMQMSRTGCGMPSRACWPSKKSSSPPLPKSIAPWVAAIAWRPDNASPPIFPTLPVEWGIPSPSTAPNSLAHTADERHCSSSGAVTATHPITCIGDPEYPGYTLRLSLSFTHPDRR